MTPYDSNGHWYSDDPMQRDGSGFFAALKDKNHAEVIGKLTAEIERLRAALTDMLKHFKQYEDAECCKRVYAQARRALEPKP